MGISRHSAGEALKSHPDDFRRGALKRFVAGMSDQALSDLEGIQDTDESAEIAGFLDRSMDESGDFGGRNDGACSDSFVFCLSTSLLHLPYV